MRKNNLRNRSSSKLYYVIFGIKKAGLSAQGHERLYCMLKGVFWVVKKSRGIIKSPPGFFIPRTGLELCQSLCQHLPF